MKKMKDKFDGLYRFMSGSSNRTSRLQKLQEILDEQDLTIRAPQYQMVGSTKCSV